MSTVILCKGFDTSRVICRTPLPLEEIKKANPGYYFHIMRTEALGVYVAVTPNKQGGKRC